VAYNTGSISELDVDLFHLAQCSTQWLALVGFVINSYWFFLVIHYLATSYFALTRVRH
jgi:hypothetical protein